MYLTAIQHSTGLYQGAAYLKVPTPFGSSRNLLGFKTEDGFKTIEEAVSKINNMYPKLKPANVYDIIKDDLDDNILPKLKPGYCLTVITPRDKEEIKKYPLVEISEWESPSAPVLKIIITPSHVRQLLNRKLVEFYSTSGIDYNLYYIYDTYILL